MNILFIAMNNMGDFTGGDRIWIELAKRWKPKAMLQSIQAYNICFDIKQNSIKPTLWNLMLNTIIRTIQGFNFIRKVGDFEYIYSVSDFYPDLLPALWYKVRHPKTKWIAGYYLISAPFWASNSPYKGKLWFRGLLYWLMQRVSLKLVNKHADVVFVTSEPDKAYFPRKRVVVVRGGVDMREVEGYQREMGILPFKERFYDCVFVGRFHYQKGVLELIKIWEQIVQYKPKAQLTMIGNGVLEGKVKELVKKLGLENNITLMGYLNGRCKYDVFRESKIIVHPATFDSGGMACAEGMAFGLPAVGFNLPAYETYYPKGMMKAPNKAKFVGCIFALLADKEVYNHYSQDALDLINEHWDWDKQAERIWKEVLLD